MKPRDKVVTAEDIQNSLYFVHFEQPEDVQLIDPPRPTSRPNSANGPIQRKPVEAKRKPVPGTLIPTDRPNAMHVSAANQQQTPTPLLGPDYVPRQSIQGDRYDDENRPPLPRRPSPHPVASGTSLTLIRRDPASGAQWNVARIQDPTVPDVSSSTSNDPTAKRKLGAPVYLEITNPGYSKFLHAQPPPLLSRNTNASNTAHSSAQSSPFAGPVGAESGDGVFRRRLWMEGAKYQSSEFGHRRLKSSDSGMLGGSPRSSSEVSQYGRSSMDARPPLTPPFLAQASQSYNGTQGSEKHSNFRGYVFTSPWDGRCEFITGSGGGSLKVFRFSRHLAPSLNLIQCRHIVPGLQGAPPIAFPVSELRFNLPGSSRASTPRGEESSKRSSFFHRPRHSRNNSSVSDSRMNSSEDDPRSFERMDLSLGQEYAGGGFGGKRAKLGKLIIEDEGLKMVDLLVAANLALWWRAYER